MNFNTPLTHLTTCKLQDDHRAEAIGSDALIKPEFFPEFGFIVLNKRFLLRRREQLSVRSTKPD